MPFTTLWRLLRAWPDIDAHCRRVYPQTSWRAWRLRWRLAARMVWHLPHHLDGVQLFSHPVLQPLLAADPRMLRKVYNDYPCSGLSVPERARQLRTHHELALALLQPSLLGQVLTDAAMVLCRAALPQGRGVLTIQLTRAQRFEREGELCLALVDPFGTTLYALTFSFEQHGGLAGILVGALQGRLPLEVARDLTKFCLGVRPPNLLVFALQVLATELGLGHIRAVGQRRHVYGGTATADRLRFDYDAFWSAAGGVAGDDGFFSLPLQPRERSREEIPANKRSQYGRRYAWLAGLSQDMQTWLRAHRIPGRPPS
jgi:uncharacterized protein VirK/YbjX